jgi:transposase InsO family protein
MDLHQNARSCPASRALLVERVTKRGWSVREAATGIGLSERRAYVWLARFRREGMVGLRDRSSRPHRVARRTSVSQIQRAIALRQHKRSAIEIAEAIGVPRSTIARWLARHGLGRLRQLAPPEPVRRYERQFAGDLLHLDTKKLARIGLIGHRITGDRSRKVKGLGWEFAHVAIDDASRVAYVEVLENERAPTMGGFLRRAVSFFASSGVQVRNVLTDNAWGYLSHAFTAACDELGIRHHRTKPYHPRTNGKAERFIQTLQREWAYGRPFSSSADRTALLPRYIHFYNCHRTHASLGGAPPISRLNNVVRNNS